MQNVIYYIFFFIIIPMVFALFFFDKKSRNVFAFMIMGIVMCLLASEINALVLDACSNDFFYLSTTLSPIIEEVLKALPLAFAAFVLFDECSLNELISCGFASGLGFAIFENIVSFYQNINSVTMEWALARGFGSGLVHGICTGVVGIGFYIIRKEKGKAFFLMMGLLSAVCIYHGIYNCMVQTSSMIWLGLAFPAVTYVILFLVRKRFEVIKQMIKKQEFI